MAELVLSPAKLAGIVESSFPLPIAVAFAQWRRDAERRDVQALGAVLDATLRHLATVAVNDALAGSGVGEGRTSLTEVMGDFKKPLSPAKWLDVLRLSLRALDRECRKPTMPGLDDWFRTNTKEIDAALALRNRARPDHDELAHVIQQLLTSLAALPPARLAWLDSSSLSHDLHVALLLWLDGAQSAKGKIALSEGVDPDVVYLIAPSSKALLSLDPLYRVIRCPACNQTHLFQLEERKRSELRFTAIGFGHRIVVNDRQPSLRRFLRGHRGRRVVDRLSIPLERTPPNRSRGDVVGKRHRIQRVLREVGLGHRYAATDQSTHRAVALEVLPYQLLRDPDLIAELSRETAAVRALSHPHLVPIFDDGIDGGDHYLAIELPSGWPVEGARALDVSELPKPISAKTALAIAKQTLQGLAFLHGRGFVHGDLRPSSLLLFNGGNVRVSDYGLARSRSRILLNLTGKPADPKYMSPERRDGAELDARSDLYSLGVILDELLAGTLPDAPKAFAAAVAKALEKDPARRHESAPAFLDALALTPHLAGRAWFEIVESRDPALRAGDRIEIPQGRTVTIGDGRCTVSIAGMPATAAIIEWSERDRTFTIRHGGMSPTVPIQTTVDGSILTHFIDAPPRVLHDHTAIVLQSFGRPLLIGTFHVELHAAAPPSSSFVKFRCDHCNATYLVARTKLRMPTVKAHCKRCSREIIVVRAGA